MSKQASKWFDGSGMNMIKTTLLMAVLFVSSAVWAMDAPRTGTFNGLSNHATSGSVTLVKEGDGYVIQLGEDFMFDGAPDPKVAFGKNGQYDASTLLEPLKSNSGAQSYAVPASLNPADYDEIYIWCERYSVGLGVASIK